MQKLTAIEQELSDIQAKINKDKFLDWLLKSMISDERIK